jgi:hypothetical protein
MDRFGLAGRRRVRFDRLVMGRACIVIATVALGLGLGACGDRPPEVTPETEASGSSGTAGGTGAVGSTSSTGTSGTPGSSTSSGGGEGSSGALDSTGTSSGSTAAIEGSGSSSEGTTGEASTVGCADGFREALLDEALHPDLAACAGGFWVPGVALATPLCDRQGGDDGPLPDGMGCTIDDLCADGWHLCTSRQEVAAAGLASCNGQAWGGQFFATGQSGEGANTCNDTGTNDVFGCGDIGYVNISECAPLNRSTGNLCVNLSGSWTCSEDAYDEVSYLVKPGSDAGGALCCRDGI